MPQNLVTRTPFKDERELIIAQVFPHRAQENFPRSQVCRVAVNQDLGRKRLAFDTDLGKRQNRRPWAGRAHPSGWTEGGQD
jgi:hypothetical protein